MGTERAAEELAHIAAEYVSREANRDTLITVTRAMVSPNGKRATVFVSVFPEAKEESALHFLVRHGTDFRSYLKGRAKFRVIPFIEFAIDEGEKNRRTVMAIPLE